MTTTLKLPPELKRKIAPLARRAGVSPHAWMVDALRREAALSELRERFLEEAEQAAEEIDAGGPVYELQDVHAYLRAKLRGRSARRPAPARAKPRR